MNVIRLISWLFLVLVALWLVLTWAFGVSPTPSEPLCFFSIMQFLAVHSIPAWPRAG